MNFANLGQYNYGFLTGGPQTNAAVPSQGTAWLNVAYVRCSALKRTVRPHDGWRSVAPPAPPPGPASGRHAGPSRATEQPCVGKHTGLLSCAPQSAGERTADTLSIDGRTRRAGPARR